MGNQPKITPKIKQAFLEILSETGNISQACKTFKISRNAFYKLRKKDKKFDEAWEIAEVQGVDLLIEEARKRAMDGDKILLMFLIKGKRKEYCDMQKVDVGGNITVNTLDFYVKEQGNKPSK